MKTTFTKYLLTGMLMLLGCLSTIKLNSQTNPTCSRLTELYNTTDGDNWNNNDNWLDPGCDVCDWYGINCNQEGVIIGIDLSNNNLNGFINNYSFLNTPAEDLLTVDFSNNDLSGQVPQSFALMFNATSINLSNNNFSGTISNALINNFCPSSIINVSGNECLCQNSSWINICNNPSLCSNLEVSGPSLIYVGQSATFTASGGANYQWSNGSNTNSITVSPPLGEYEYTVYSSYNGCLDTVVVELEVTSNNPYDNQQGALLDEIYKKMGGINWTNEVNGLNPWNLNDLSSYCSWYGIECDELGRVIAIELQDNNLVGTIPEELGYFSALELLNMSNNFIEDCFPATCYDYCNSIDMFFSYNCDMPFDGYVPDICDYITTTGSCDLVLDVPPMIQDTLDQCDGSLLLSFAYPLEYAWVNGPANGNFRVYPEKGGSTYYAVTQCGDTASITLDEPFISPEYDQFVELYNSTDGPNWFQQSGANGISWLEGCNVCEWYGVDCNELMQVTEVDLSNNNLDGNIPFQIFHNIPSLTTLDLSHNKLTGSSLLSFQGSQNLNYYDVSDNDLHLLTGLSFANTAINVSYVDISSNSNNIHNNFIDQSRFPASIEYLDISNNMIAGEITGEFSNLTNLTHLDYSDNLLEGCYPVDFNFLCNINFVDFTNNPCLWLEGDFDAYCADPVCNFFVFDYETEICQGETTSITVSGPTSVLWSTGETTFTINVSPDSIANYSVIDQCGRIDSVKVIVNPLQFTNLYDTICANEYVEFADTLRNLTDTYTHILADIKGCDSTVYFHLEVIPLPERSTSIEICEGDTLFIGDSEYTVTGQYIDTLDQGAECDSIIYTDLWVHPKEFTFLTDTICHYDSVLFGGGWRYETDQYLHELTTQYGCDSFVYLDLFVYEQIVDSLFFVTICANEPYEFEGIFYDQADSYEIPGFDANGCVYNRILDLTVTPLEERIETPSICWNETYSINGNTYTESDTYIDTLYNSDEFLCDTIVTTILTIKPKPQDSIFSIEICDNESYTFEGITYVEENEYILPGIYEDGCIYDRVLQLQVNPLIDKVVHDTICHDETYQVLQNIYDESGIYFDELENTNGLSCDTIQELHLFVRPISPDSTFSISICDNESYFFEGVEFSEAEIYILPGIDVFGCNYFRVLDLDVITLPNLLVDENICWNESINIYGTIYNASGTYVDTISSMTSGCDTSVVIEIFQYPKTPDQTISETICANDSILFQGQYYNETTVVTETIQDENGCDYETTLDLTVLPLETKTVTETICWDETIEIYNILFDQAGSEELIVPSITGSCDTIITIIVNEYPKTDDELTATTICDNEHYEFLGEIYEDAGNFPVTLYDGNGCSYIHELILTVESLPTEEYNETICWYDSIQVYEVYYSEEGTFYDTVPNIAGGCDIAVEINLQKFPITSDETFSQTICDNESFTFHGNTYTDPGTYSLTLQDANGCDFTSTLLLGVDPNPTITNDYLICPGDTIHVHNSSYYQSGSYQDTIGQSTGCDSIIISNITLLTNETLVLDTVICIGQDVYGYSSPGTYNFNLDNGTCETEVTLILDVEDNPTNTYFLELCTGDSVSYNNEWYYNGGQYYDTISHDGLCDSIVTISITEYEVDTFVLMETICANESYNGFTESGYYEYTEGGVNCPVLYQLTLTVNPLPTLTVMDSICWDGTYDYHGQTYSEGGVYEQTIPAENACDTAVTLILFQFPATDDVIIVENICGDESIDLEGETYDEEGIYTLESIDGNGCRYTITLDLRVEDLEQKIINETICAGDSVLIYGVYYSEPNNYTDTISSASESCDTAVFINIFLHEITLGDTTEVMICANDTYTFLGETYNEAGTYTGVSSDINNCPYTRTLILITEPNPTREHDVLLCPGDSIIIGNEVYYEQGSYVTNVINSGSCDSIITTNITLAESTLLVIDSTICANESAYGFTENGVHEFQLDNGACTVDVQMTLTVEDLPQKNITTYICSADSFYLNGTWYNETQWLRDTIEMSTTCDTLVDIYLEVRGYNSYVDTTICENDIYMGYNETGTYIDVIPVGSGCYDSLFINLEVVEEPFSSKYDTICIGDSLEFFGTYVQNSGLHEALFPVEGVCDSVVRLNLFVVEETSFYIDTTLCAGESYQGYSETGIHNYSTNIGGNCTLDITLDITVLEPDKNEQAVSICAGDSLFVGDNFYTSTGVYNDTLMNQFSCDSTIKTFLTVLFVDTIPESVTICSGDTYNGFSQSGTYYYALDNGGICSDIAALDLSVIAIPTDTLSLILCEGDSILIDNQYVNEAGMYLDSLQSISLCDSIVTYDLSIHNGDTVFISADICEGQIYDGFTESGVYNYTIDAVGDCVVDVELTLSVQNTDPTFNTLSLCIGDSISHNDSIYFAGDTIIDSLSSIEGCDSIVVSEIIDQAFNELFIDTIICQGDTLYGETVSGEYTLFIEDGTLCETLLDLDLVVIDSVVIENQTVISTSCSGDDGSITFSTTQEISGAEYSIDGGQTWKDTAYFDQLSGGDYSILVNHNNLSCVSNILFDFTVPETNSLSMDTIVYQPIFCEGELGYFHILASNGTGPFTYEWSDGSTEIVRDDLVPGNYVLTITDNSGCVGVFDIDLGEGESIVSDYEGAEVYEFCDGDEIVLETTNPLFEHVWLKDGIPVDSSASYTLTSEGEYTLISRNAVGCEVYTTIIAELPPIDFSGIDFLVPYEGLINTPIALINVSNPSADSSGFNLENDSILLIQQIDNRTVVQFLYPGIYTLSFTAIIDNCPKIFYKTINIYETEEELEFPENYQVYNAEITNVGLYPNPNSGLFQANISLSASLPITINIIDLNGNVVWDTEQGEQLFHEVPIDVTFLPSGPYSFMVFAGMDWKYISFVKE